MTRHMTIERTPCPDLSLTGTGLCDIREVLELLHCGRTKVFELLREGHLSSVRVGRRRLVVRSSVESLLAELLKGT